MKLGRQILKTIGSAKNSISGAGHTALAGAAAIALAMGNLGRTISKAAGEIRSRSSQVKSNKSGEGIFMKKSTFVALLVAFATVAGILGALYVYVLRREKELDEYEQLLFSEDFNDDLPEEDNEPEEDK